MFIRDIMTREVQACRVGDTLADAARAMWDHDCGCVPIIDEDDRPIAMLTDRDIAMACHLTGRAPAELKVESVMSRALYICLPGDTIETAEAIMRDRQVRRLPVVSEDRLIGILSMNDLIRAATERKLRHKVRASDVENTMAAICQPRVPVPAAVH